MITSYLYMSILQVKYHFTEGHKDHMGFYCQSTPVLRTLESTTLVCDWVRYFYFCSIFFGLFRVLYEASTPVTFTTICEKIILFFKVWIC